MKRVLLMTLVCLVTVTSMAVAGTSDDARIALHRRIDTSATAKLCTTLTPNAANLACNGFNTSNAGAAFPLYEIVYVAVGHGPAVGINGVSFGFDYNGRAGMQNGIDPASNTWYQLGPGCADGFTFGNDGGFGDFPAPKGGARVTWITCVQNNIGGFGTQAIAGALRCYLYAPDQLSVTPNNNVDSGPELNVASCDGTETALLAVFPPFAHYSLMGRVDWGGGAGLNPCLIVPARETTWGKIKDLYNQ